MNPAVIARLRRHLAAQAGLPDSDLCAQPIRVWRLSGVQRLHLPTGMSVVFKYALPPFTGEARVLAHVAAHGVPVPRVFAAVVLDGMLGMILEDLGEPVREPTEQDAAAVSARLHVVSAAPWLARLGEPDLAALPDQALAGLQQLRAEGRFEGGEDLLDILAALTRVAPARAAGAEKPPFGLCHGELHPSAVHLGPAGWRLLDFAMTFTGPGLLDLAAWSGLRQPADPPRTRRLIEHYVRTGGHRDALADRGGLPAEHWALGWHRIHAAHWLLSCATSGIDAPDTDPRHIPVLRRQLTSALALFTVPSTFPFLLGSQVECDA